MSAARVVGKNFQIVAELSSGGFGQTFLAEDLRVPARPKCVIKQLKTQTDDPKIVDLAFRLFEQEVAVLYQLGKHPQIPSLISHFKEDGEFYLVQEYIEGNTFAQELERGKLYNQAEVIEITSQLLDVLSFVHQQNVIHRDVKPTNLINRKSDGKIVLIDFGAVKQVRSQTANPNQKTQATIAIGSDGYMPVEQLGGHPKFSSDVYAVGMFAIQLLTRSHPTQLRQNQRTGEWIWQDKTSLNPHFAEVLNQMIRYDFRQRFTDANEANARLKRLNLGNGNYAQVDRQSNLSIEPHKNGLTNATYSLSVPAAEEAPEFTKPVNFHNQKCEPSDPRSLYQPLPFNQPTVSPIQHNPMMNQPFRNQPSSETRYITQVHLPGRFRDHAIENSENITMGALAYDNLWDSTPIRAFLGVIFVIIAVFGGSYILVLSADTRMKEARFSPKPAQAKVYTNSHKAAALKKQAIAKTSSDWIQVSQEWKLAAEFFAIDEMTAADLDEKQNLTKAKNQANGAKDNANQMVEKLRLNERKSQR